MSTTDAFAQVLRFHGHECPGAAVGVRIAEVAVARFGRNAPDNRIIAVAETDSCAVDAVQVIAGCTYGTRTLLHEDNGKYAFAFWRGSDGEGIRVTARPGGDAFRSEQIWVLADKMEDGTATEAEAAEFRELQAMRIKRILAADTSDIVETQEVRGHPPARKPLFRHDTCADCGEPTSIATLHDHRGRIVCPVCHLAAHGGALPAGHADHDHGHHHPDFTPGHVPGHGH